MEEYVLQTQSLSKSFGKAEILSGIDMAIERGSVCGLVGENGAGKTTLLRVISGLMKPSHGSVRLNTKHNVLDCIICSGIPKGSIFISKVFTTVIVSLILSFIYMLPLWGYIMVYAAMGLLISIVARSSTASLIWSLAIGLILMPRFFVMLGEGAGKIFGWTGQMVKN